MCYNTGNAAEANGVIMVSSSKCMSYTAGFKLRVIETAEQLGSRSAGREHNISEKLVRDWRKKKAELKALSRTRRSQRVRSTDKLAARDRSDHTYVHPHLYAWHMGGRHMGGCTLDRSSSLARNAKRMRLISQHFLNFIFGVHVWGGATYNPV